MRRRASRRQAAAAPGALEALRPRAPRRWALAGVLLGAVAGLVAFAPAAWLARGIASATGEHLLLTEARGTLWSGSAVPVLTGGPESRTALTLPSRVEWSLHWRGLGAELRLRQACCIRGELALGLQPGFGRMRITLPPPATPQDTLRGQWPAAWLAGLGTPWNAVQLAGMVRLRSRGLEVEQVAGRSRFSGEATLELAQLSTPLVPLASLGSFQLTLRGDAAAGAASTITLTTLEGALQASGQGQWGEGRLRFRGQLQAAEGQEAALSNLLNIVGRRQGALSLISIG